MDPDRLETLFEDYEDVEHGDVVRDLCAEQERCEELVAENERLAAEVKYWFRRAHEAEEKLRTSST